MNTSTHIERSRTLSSSIDFQYLRTKGLQYIEQLSHKMWTDYNAHDPGVTTLEVLCYVLTELGYRSQFDIKKLTADPDGRINNGSFFTAKEILTNAPLTALDFRKLLIDIDGVNNAWIKYNKQEKDSFEYPLPLDNEIPIYINILEDSLSFGKLNKNNNALDQLLLRGLNKVYIELTDDQTVGNLNDVSLRYSKFVDPVFLDVQVSLDFNNWNNPKANLFHQMDKPSKIQEPDVLINTEKKLISVTVTRIANINKMLTLYIRPTEVNNLPLIANYFNAKENICALISLLKIKKDKVNFIYNEVDKRLQANRNLTEDWLCIETIDKTPISICVDIHLTAEANAEETLAKIYQRINQLLNPTIRFYTLNQMFEKGLNTTEIFNGPSLNHGFLTNNELENTNIPDCLHASYFISSIMKIDGVKNVNNFLFTAYKNGEPILHAKNQSWCLPLDGHSMPVLSMNNSKLLLFKEGIPFLLSEKEKKELSDGLSYLNTENNYFKLKNIHTDIAIPTGEYMQIDDYLSVQYEYPQVYKIGKEQLPKSATKERKAQAKQLKAYLQHFDQLLADSFSQLHHAKELLDIKTIQKTYFPNYLETIDGVEKQFFKDEIYHNNFKDVLLPTTNPTNKSLYESKEKFFSRRNQFLDHLMARFAESFNDYALMMYKIQENANGLAELKIQEQELIEDKQRFIKNYPEISRNRGLGFNYLQQASENDIWDISIKTGYEQRIALLLGINNITLRNGTMFDSNPLNTWNYNTNIGILKFKLLNDSGLNLQDKWNLAHRLLHDVSSYKVAKTPTKFYIYLINIDDQKIAKLEKSFSTKKEATIYIPKLYQAINTKLETFYCIEHILLRPLLNLDENDLDEQNNHLLQVCLNDDCFSVANQDPYSFKITIVIRGDLARFRNVYFRRYAEKIIRQEAPAHVLVKICWIAKQEMTEFQTIYRKWIIQYRSLKQNICNNAISKSLKKDYNQSLKDIIQKLNGLHTIYDSGTLYDCKLSELDNPIVLGSTSLGTL